jgi:hypothetical protein
MIDPVSDQCDFLAPVLLRGVRGKSMNEENNTSPADDCDLMPEYDFSGGVRGKYAAEYARSTNIVILEPDVAAVFHDAQAVNEAQRRLIENEHQ